MKILERNVREFMQRARQAVPVHPTMPSVATKRLRLDLISEEQNELAAANDLVSAYDALEDLLYVVVGTFVAFGLPIEPGWREVHRSNMSKFTDGRLAPNGKWLKGPSSRPPNLAKVIARLQARKRP